MTQFKLTQLRISLAVLLFLGGPSLCAESQDGTDCHPNQDSASKDDAGQPLTRDEVLALGQHGGPESLSTLVKAYAEYRIAPKAFKDEYLGAEIIIAIGSQEGVDAEAVLLATMDDLVAKHDTHIVPGWINDTYSCMMVTCIRQLGLRGTENALTSLDEISLNDSVNTSFRQFAHAWVLMIRMANENSEDMSAKVAYLYEQTEQQNRDLSVLFRMAAVERVLQELGQDALPALTARLKLLESQDDRDQWRTDWLREQAIPHVKRGGPLLGTPWWRKKDQKHKIL